MHTDHDQMVDVLLGAGTVPSFTSIATCNYASSWHCIYLFCMVNFVHAISLLSYKLTGPVVFPLNPDIAS